MTEADNSAFFAHHKAEFPEAYASGILKPEKHWKLVRRAKEFSRTAGIKPACLWDSPEGILLPKEIKWFSDYNFHNGNGKGGLVYIGEDFRPPVVDRMGALAGCFLRYYLDARVTTANALMKDNFAGGDLADARVLMVHAIPNHPSDTIQQILDSLVSERYGLGRQTVLALEGSAKQILNGTILTGGALGIIKNNYFRIS